MDRVLRFPEVKRLTGLSRTTIWEQERAGRFPRHIQISARAVGLVRVAHRCVAGGAGERPRGRTGAASEPPVKPPDTVDWLHIGSTYRRTEAGCTSTTPIRVSLGWETPSASGDAFRRPKGRRR